MKFKTRPHLYMQSQGPAVIRDHQVSLLAITYSSPGKIQQQQPVQPCPLCTLFPGSQIFLNPKKPDSTRDDQMRFLSSNHLPTAYPSKPSSCEAWSILSSLSLQIHSSTCTLRGLNSSATKNSACITRGLLPFQISRVLKPSGTTSSPCISATLLSPGSMSPIYNPRHLLLSGTTSSGWIPRGLLPPWTTSSTCSVLNQTVEGDKGTKGCESGNTLRIKRDI